MRRVWKVYFIYTKKKIHGKEGEPTIFTSRLETKLTTQGKHKSDESILNVQKFNEIEAGSWQYKLDIIS